MEIRLWMKMNLWLFDDFPPKSYPRDFSIAVKDFPLSEKKEKHF